MAVVVSHLSSHLLPRLTSKALPDIPHCSRCSADGPKCSYITALLMLGDTTRTITFRFRFRCRPCATQNLDCNFTTRATVIYQGTPATEVALSAEQQSANMWLIEAKKKMRRLCELTR